MSVAVLLVLVVVTWLGRRAVRSPALARFGAVFPSWRFFDRATGSPGLWVRFGAPHGALGAWRSIDPGAGTGGPRDHARWAFAPRGNLTLAHHAVVERLVVELGELDLEEDGTAGGALAAETDLRVTGRVSYELVTRLARAHVPAGARFQWKIAVPGVLGAPALDDYLLSPELAA